MTTISLADRVAEAERTMAALLAGDSGWPDGLIDAAVKRLETQIEMPQLSDAALLDLSTRYQAIAPHSLSTTGAALMIELARRSTLSAHERMAEAVERERVWGC